MPGSDETHTVGTLGVGVIRGALAVITEGIYLLMQKSLSTGSNSWCQNRKQIQFCFSGAKDGSVVCHFNSYFSFSIII